MICRRIFLLPGLLLALTASAQEIPIKQYTTHNGLLVDEVFCAAQDDRGFIWLGLSLGIAYFDGHGFRHYYRAEGMLRKSVPAMVYAGGDSLIFISYPEALQSIHRNGRIVTLARNIDSLFRFKPNSLARVGNRFLFYQRNDDKFCAWSAEKKLQLITTEELTGQKGVLVNALAPGSTQAEYWLCSGKGVFRIADKVVFIPFPEPVTAALPQPDGSLLFAGEKNLYRLEPGRTEPVKLTALPEAHRVLSMQEEATGKLLLCGEFKGILQWDGTRIAEVSEKLLPELTQVHRLFADADKNTWLCTEDAGVILYKKTPFSRLLQGKVERLLPVKKGLLLAGTEGLNLLRPDNIVQPVLLNGKPVKQVRYLFTDRDSGAGIAKPDPNRPMAGPVKIETNAGKTTYFNSEYASLAPDGDYRFSDNKTLYRNNFGKQPPSALLSLEKHQCRKLYAIADYKGVTWVGTDRGIIQLWPEGERRITEIGQVKIEQVQKLHIARDGRLWIATDAGLFVSDGTNFLRMDAGKANDSKENYTGNYYVDLAEDESGGIWAASWDGVYLFQKGRQRHFGPQHGLGSRIVNRLYYDAAGKKLYAGTNNSFDVLNMADTGGVLNKSVYIECRLADASGAVVESNAVLPAARYNMGFYITVPEYGFPEEMDIQYRFDEGEWITIDNFRVNLEDVGWGAHRLVVRIPGSETEFRFTIKKPFYKTGWFLLLLALAAQGAILALVLYIGRKRREAVLRKQQQLLELATLRQKAFTTLVNPHFIFNALNSIQHYINRQDRQAANRYLSDFASLIRRNFDAAQQAFIPLDQELESLRLYLQLEQMRFPGKFTYRLTVDENMDAEEQMLPTMMVQPFLENAILHGLSRRNDSGTLDIQIRRENRELHITITDNGVGMEKSRIAQANAKHTSRGMRLVREKLEVLSRFGGNPIQLAVEEAFPGDEYPGVRIRIAIPDSIYENFPGEAALQG